MKVKCKIKKEDMVIVISGKDKGKTGKVLQIDAEKRKVLVEGKNIQKKTIKKSQENPTGGITEKEGFIHISNVAFYEGEKATRLGIKIEKGEKIRFSKRTGKPV